MNPYPSDHSILILDNCAIHKSQSLHEVVKAHGMCLNCHVCSACLLITSCAGCFMLFLPPYSPDLNLIKESFASGEFHSNHTVNLCLDLYTWSRPGCADTGRQPATMPTRRLCCMRHAARSRRKRQWHGLDTLDTTCNYCIAVWNV